MKELMLPLAALVAGAGLADGVATDVVAGSFRRGEASAPADVAFEGRLVRASDALSLDKTGAGNWSLSSLGLFGIGGFGVNVLDGILTVSDAGARPAAALTPPTATANAALWLKSDTHVTFQGDGTSVATWYDVRESNAGGVWGSSYLRAGGRIAGLEGDVYPTTRTDDRSRRFVYCNGAKSGSYLIFQQTTGADYTQDLGNIRHVFLVARFTDSYGWPLGNLGTSCCFYPYPDDGSLSGAVYAFAQRCSPYAASGRFYRNAERIDPTQTAVSTGVQLLEWESPSPDVTIGLGCFFRDRNRHTDTKWGVHNGGDDLGEVLIFTNALTTAERLDVESYLMDRWLGRRLVPAAYAPSVTAGATAVVESDEGVGFGDSRPVVPTGDGVLEKRGEGTALLMDDAAFRRASTSAASPVIKVTAGSLDVNVGEVTAAPVAGKGMNLTVRMNDLPTLAGTSAEAGVATLSGDTAYRVKGFGDDVQRLNVEADKLILASAQAAAETPVAGAVEATIPNPSFEEGDIFTQNPSQFATKNGWWFRTSGSSYVYKFNLNATASDNWKVNHPHKTPEGNVVIGLWGDSAMGTTATVPVSGRYELSFLACKSGDSYAGEVDVMIVQAGVTNRLGVCRPVHWNGFERICYKTPWIESGSCEVIVASRAVDPKKMFAHLDGFHLRRCTDETAEVFPVPNGSFECASFPAVSSATAMNDAFSVLVTHTIEGWTLTQGETIRSPFAWAVSRFMKGYYAADGSAYGGVQLGLYRTAGRATSPTFRLPAGRWALRVKLTRWTGEAGNETWWWKSSPTSGAYLSGKPTVTAKVSVSGVETTLGTLTGEFATQTLTFPTAFVSDGATECQLVLGQDVDGAAALLDDLEFVKVDGGSLVQDGSFDVMSKWSYSANAQWIAGVNKWYGFSTCGKSASCLVLTQNGSASQDVTFPENGVYELAFMVRPRTDVSGADALLFGYGYNQIRACLETDADGRREIFRTPHILATNFVRQAISFEIKDAPCTKKLVLQGCNGLANPDGSVEDTKPLDYPSGAMKTAVSLIDDVSLVRKSASLGAPPTLPATTEVRLATKARLQLDYAGQVRLGRLKLGGKFVSGVIDATHRSGLVSGPGSVYVEPRGCCIVVR